MVKPSPSLNNSSGIGKHADRSRNLGRDGISSFKIYKFSDQILMLLTEDWIPFLVEKKQGGGDTYLK